MLSCSQENRVHCINQIFREFVNEQEDKRHAHLKACILLLLEFLQYDPEQPFKGRVIT